MKNKGLIPFGVLLILAMVLSACASGGASVTSAPTQAVGVPTTAPLATSPSAITGTAGLATSTPAGAAATSAAPTTAPTMAATQALTGTASTGAAATALPAMSGCPLPPENGANISFSGLGRPDRAANLPGCDQSLQAGVPGCNGQLHPDPGNFQDKMKAQMAGGTAPDVFYVDDQLMTAFAPSGQLLPLET